MSATPNRFVVTMASNGRTREWKAKPAEGCYFAGIVEAPDEKAAIAIAKELHKQDLLERQKKREAEAPLLDVDGGAGG